MGGGNSTHPTGGDVGYSDLVVDLVTVQRVSADSPTIGAGFTAGFSSAFGDTITRSTLIAVEDDETSPEPLESIAGIPIAWSEG